MLAPYVTVHIHRIAGPIDELVDHVDLLEDQVTEEKKVIVVTNAMLKGGRRGRRTTPSVPPEMHWGLGIEHEMLVGVDCPPAPPSPSSDKKGAAASVTCTLDSAEIVKAITTRRIEAVYATVGKALKLVLPPPQAERVVVASASVASASGKRPPFPARLGACADPEAALAAVPERDLRAFLHAEYPLVFDEWGGPTRLGLEWVGREPVLAARTALWAAALPAADRADAGRGIYDMREATLRTLALRLMLSGSATDAFVGTLAKGLEGVAAQLGESWPREGAVLRLMSGEVWSMPVWAQQLPSVRARQRARKGAPRTPSLPAPLSPTDLIRCVAGATLIPAATDGGAIEVDSGFVEVKTLEFRNLRVEDAVEQLQVQEATVLDAARALDPSARILPRSGYARLREVKGASAGSVEEPSAASAGYAGSYHFWFTLPHEPFLGRIPAGPRLTAAHRGFAEAHAAFALGLQWLEPLLLSLTAGDPRALGTGVRHPRASMRGVLNPLSGAGGTDVCRRMRLGMSGMSSSSARPLEVYASERDFVDAVIRGRPVIPGILEAGEDTQLYYSVSPGVTEPYLGCHHASRMDWPGEEPEPFRDDEAATQGKPFVPPSHPHNRLLRMHHAAGFEMATGNDVRFEWCRNFRLPLLPGWTPHVVREPMGRLAFRFVDADRKRWTAVAPIAPGTKGGPKGQEAPRAVGFEFRLMDNMPSEHLPELMRLFVLVAAAMQSDPADAPARCDDTGSRRPLYDPDWSRATAAVLVKGRHAPVGAAYVAKLRAVLGLPASAAAAAAAPVAREALLEICRDLHVAHGRHPWLGLLLRDPPTGLLPPVPADTNTLAWREAFEDLRKPGNASPALRAKLTRAIEARRRDSEGSVSQAAWTRRAIALLGEGWRHDLPYLWSSLPL